MKLSYKKTMYVGMAFFIIALFWQTYDTIVPKILVDKFGMSQGLSGFIMALDNIFALFLLPLFGHWSDKTKTKIGKRKPYIIIGTILAAVLFVSTSFADNVQLTNISGIENNQIIYDSGVLDNQNLKIDGLQIRKALEKDQLSDETFIALSQDNNAAMFNKYIKPARQAFAWKKTVESPSTLIAFMILLFFVLISMSVFRSPAVALMPDVTIKPLRSKANAVINLMGALGGIIVLILGMFFKTGSSSHTYQSYTSFFVTVSVLMLVILLFFVWKVKENNWTEQMHSDSLKLDEGISNTTLSADENKAANKAALLDVESITHNLYENQADKISTAQSSIKTLSQEKLPKDKMLSLIFILSSVFLWFMGYNAVTSKFSVYSGTVLNLDYNLPLIIAQASAIVSFIPIGIISSKLGRKKTILAGIILLAVSFGSAYFISHSSGKVMYVLFGLAGIGWATINVNSFPMVVELANEKNIGKYTGFYYTASMAAQIITPIASGFLMDIFDMKILFPYGTIFIILSFLTMFVTKHGDNKPEKKVGLEAFDN